MVLFGNVMVTPRRKIAHLMVEVLIPVAQDRAFEHRDGDFHSVGRALGFRNDHFHNAGYAFNSRNGHFPNAGTRACKS